MWRIFGFTFGLLALWGCDTAPKLPTLPGPAPDPIERIVLDDQLTTSDIRALFRAVNRHGKLDGLRPWFDSENDGALERFSRLVIEVLFEEAHHPHGLVTLLQERLRTNAILPLVQWTQDRTKAEYQALHQAFFDPRTPALVRSQRRWLEPRLSHIIAKLPSLKLQPWPEGEPKIEIWFPELASLLLGEPRHWGHIAPTVQGWLDHRIVPSLLAGLGATKKDNPKSLVGASWGLSQMARENALPRVLTLMDLLNQPSDGLFASLEATLIRSPHLVRELGGRVEPHLAAAVGGFVKEGLQSPPVGGPFDNGFWKKILQRDPTQPPTREWTHLFIAVRASVEKVTGGPGGGFGTDGFLKALPLYLNSYGLTLWIEQFVRSQWQGLQTSKNFDHQLWNTPFSAAPWNLELAQADTQGNWELRPNVKQDLTSLGLGDFVRELELIVPREGFGSFYFEVPGGEATLGKLLRDVTRSLHQTRAFGDPTPLLQALVYGLSRDEGGLGFRLKDLETSNMAVGLHRLLALLAPENWKRVEHFLFEDVGLGELTSEDRQFLLSLYEGNAPLQARVEQILDMLPALQTLNTSVDGQPSFLSVYVRLLRHLPGESFLAWIRTWTTVKALEITDRERFPGLIRLIDSGKPVAQVLESLAAIDPRHHAYLTDLVGECLSAPGLESLWNWAGTHFSSDPQAWVTLFQGAPPAWNWKDEERLWALAFVENGHFRELWTLVSQTSRKEGLALVSNLLTLSRSGELAAAFRLLGRVQNPSIVRTAQMFLEWDRSGQLTPLLEGLAHWMRETP